MDLDNYLALNARNTILDSFKTRVCLALSFITGDQTRNWKTRMLAWIQDPNTDDNAVTGLAFIDMFKEEYADNQKGDRARQRIENLRMKGINVDQYISDFLQLATDANYDMAAEGTRVLFIRGLPLYVTEEVVKQNPQNWPALRTAAINATGALQKLRLLYGDSYGTSSAKGGGSTSGATRAPPPFWRPNTWRTQTTQTTQPRFNSTNAPRAFNNVPVPMDLGRTRGFRRGPLGPARGNVAQVTPKDRSQLKCFNCGKLGHFARDCRSQKKTRIAQMDLQDQLTDAGDATLVDWTPQANEANPMDDTVRAFRAFSVDQQQQFVQQIGLANSQEQDFPDV